MMTTAGFVVRILFACFLIFGIYNPFQYSYYHWVVNYEGEGVTKLFAGLVLAFLLFIHLQATWRSMRLIGVSLVMLVTAAAGWVLADYEVIDLSDPTVFSLAMLTGIAVVLGAGQSWSLIRYRLSGQVDSQSLV